MFRVGKNPVAIEPMSIDGVWTGCAGLSSFHPRGAFGTACKSVLGTHSFPRIPAHYFSTRQAPCLANSLARQSKV